MTNDAGVPPPPSPLGNRMSIAHLMLWTAATAILMARFQYDLRAVLQGASEVGPSFQRFLWVVNLVSFCFAPAYGASVASLLLLGSRWFGWNAPFPTQPGHWLLLIVGSSMISWMVGRAVMNYWVSNNPPGAVIVLMLLPGTLFMLGSAIAVHHPWRWRAALWLGCGSLGSIVLLGGVAIAAGPGQISESVEFLIVLPELVFVASFLWGLIAGLIDLRYWRQFDFLHWAGVSVLWCIVGHWVALSVALATMNSLD